MLACCLAGCGISKPATVDFDSQLTAAVARQGPAAILIIDRQSPADEKVARQFEHEAVSAADRIATMELDISNSKNRADAARFHPVITPLLVCISPEGLNISRDERPDNELMIQRINEAVQRYPELDKHFISLVTDVLYNLSSPKSRMQLAEFRLSLHNDKEAIPNLKFVADSENADLPMRVRAWVNLVRAHQWVLEPEKGRHEAKALIAALGDKNPEAMSGGKLMLGIQDANAKRFALAMQEFDQAIAADPDSPYAEEARQAEKKLPALQTSQP